MTHMTLQAVRQLIANDSYAITFQSIGQYRAALLRHVDSLVDFAQPYASSGIVPGGLHLVGEGPIIATAAQQAESGAQVSGSLAEVMLAMQIAADKLELIAAGQAHGKDYDLDGGKITATIKHAKVMAAYALERLQPARTTLARLYRSSLAAQSQGAQQAAAPGALLAILREVHDTLAGESDSDIDHFEDDDEEREGAPVQYAARKVMEVVDMIKATAPSVPTPEAPARHPAQRRAGPGGWK